MDDINVQHEVKPSFNEDQACNELSTKAEMMSSNEQTMASNWDTIQVQPVTYKNETLNMPLYNNETSSVEQSFEHSNGLEEIPLTANTTLLNARNDSSLYNQVNGLINEQGTNLVENVDNSTEKSVENLETSRQITDQSCLEVVKNNEEIPDIKTSSLGDNLMNGSADSREIINISPVNHISKSEIQINELSDNIPVTKVNSNLSQSSKELSNNNNNLVPSSKSVQNSPIRFIPPPRKFSSDLSLEEVTDMLLNDTEIPADSIIRSSSESIRSEHISNETSSRSSPFGINGISGSISNHPAYKMAMQDLLSFREQVGALRSEIERLEKEKQALEADRSPEIFQLQLETLEKTVAQQARQLDFAKDEAIKQDEAAVAALASAKIQYDKLKRNYEEANRECETTVVRYAVSERELLRLKEEVATLDKKLLESTRERDAMLSKLKAAVMDKTKACHVLEAKCSELTSQSRELEKLKDEINSRDIKIKWAQNKIRSEMDAHKETQQKFEKASARLQEAREEMEQVKKDAQVLVRSCQQGREDKTQQLELQVQEQKAQLITERHARQDAEDARKAALAEAAEIKSRHQQMLDENNTLSVKVQNLEKERLETDQRLFSFQQAEQLRCQVEADNESLSLQVQQQEERWQASQCEVERLRQSNLDYIQDAQACREREAELLAYTQQLTDKVVRLQSESSATQARAQQMECEREPLARRVAELEGKLAELTAELTREKSGRLEESQLLARKLAEKQEWGERMTAQLEEARGECAVLKRKQAQATKELSRELHQCRKRLDQYEGPGTSLSLTSKTSSQTSLNTLDSTPAKQNSVQESSASLDPQMLIEHIGKLQRKNARQTEKIEFLEEHTRTLVGEVQKKARLIQGLVMRDEAGALSSRASDRSKAELSRHGGVMASVYTSTPSDETMTLELSLEINRKLQAVLEDTLLKNITLKENMDTLGQEIERLSAQLNATRRSKVPMAPPK